jgi:hypothetical protein
MKEVPVSGSGRETVDLAPVVAAARMYPGSFLAGWVGGADEEGLAARLGLDRLQMQRLLLCRPPRSAAEAAQIAGFVGAPPAALAEALREQGIPGS